MLILLLLLIIAVVDIFTVYFKRKEGYYREKSKRCGTKRSRQLKNEVIVKWTDIATFMHNLYNEIHLEMKEFGEVESTDAVMYVAGKKAMLDFLGWQLNELPNQVGIDA